jgi:hypothetical protein
VSGSNDRRASLPRWYGETLAWAPALEVTLELVDGDEYSGRLITPEPELDPETGALALWFQIPGKLRLHPIPMADVAAFTVHTPRDRRDPGSRGIVRDLALIAWYRLTGRGFYKPPPVTDAEPRYTLVWAWISLDRDDAEFVDEVRCRTARTATRPRGP